MLFGYESNWKEMLQKAQEIATEKHFKLVYAATTGSISKGIPAIDSDYDIRFLFIKEDSFEKKYDPRCCREEDIVYRHFQDESHNLNLEIKYTYDRLAFWELTSFLKLIVTPQIGEETWDKNGLYYIVEHTFLTPYAWDPYGIQLKVIPLINSYFKKQYSYPYYKKVMERRTLLEKIRTKDYIDAVWAALSVTWIDKYKQAAPIDFWTLLSQITSVDEREFIRKWMLTKIEECNEVVSSKEHRVRTRSRTSVFMDRDDKIEGIIDRAYTVIQNSPLCEEYNVEEQYQRIDIIIEVIERSVAPLPVWGLTVEL